VDSEVLALPVNPRIPVALQQQQILPFYTVGGLPRRPSIITTLDKLSQKAFDRFGNLIISRIPEIFERVDDNE